MKDHLVFSPDRCGAICATCRKMTDRPHVIGVKDVAAYCAACCPACQVPKERTGEVKGLSGEQESMFGLKQE